MSAENEIKIFSQFQIDRCQHLHHASKVLGAIEHTFDNLERKQKKPSFRIKVNGEGAVLTVDPHFAFGVWLAKRSLKEDLEKEGEGETAEQIIYESKRK